ELVSVRANEGGVLARDLDDRMRGFFPVLDQVKALVPVRQQEYDARKRARVKAFIAGAPVADDRTRAEIGAIADQHDGTDEILVLEAHLNHFLETLASHKGPGKRLGFLLQEMLREVNTLGTKSQFPDMQHLCVGWKEELEIIREQIQNIE